MKLTRLLLTLVVSISTFLACEENPYGPTGSVPEPGKPEQKDTTETPVPAVYAKGADISWLTQMEQDGVKFYDSSGEERDCVELMKELGFNSIRLRVWVNPEDGWCAKEDVLEKASRAYNLGMRIMIDFHYSDTWADPSKQNPPAAWKSYSADQMASAVAAHTKDVLQALKDVGIDVEWVQVGNEVNSGMLHPLGKVQGSSAGNFVSFLNAGYKAVKDIYPNAKVILHVSNGHDSGLFDWFYSLMKDNAAKYDIIGMSLYPTWWENGGWSNWSGPVNSCVANIKTISTKFGKPVMICETGFPVSEAQMAKQALQSLLDQTRQIEDCLGLFYWEPQTDGIWKPSSYNALGWNAYNMGAFSNGKATAALDPFAE